MSSNSQIYIAPGTSAIVLGHQYHDKHTTTSRHPRIVNYNTQRTMILVKRGRDEDNAGA